MELAIVGTEQKSVHNHLRMLLDHSERSTVPKPPLPLKSGTSKVGVETHREVDLVARHARWGGERIEKILLGRQDFGRALRDLTIACDRIAKTVRAFAFDA